MRLIPPPLSPRRRYLSATALCLVTTLATLPMSGHFDLANIVMLFLLTVFACAVYLGRGPAVWAAFLAVALFDFFFVPPQLTFAVADAQYLVTFAVMLVVGLIASQLAARLAERTEEAQRREAETRLLYELARDLGGALAVDQVAAITGDFLRRLEAKASLLVVETDAGGVDFRCHGGHSLGTLEQSFARSAYERRAVVEADSLAGMGVATVFLPLLAPTQCRGVLAVTPHTDDADVVRAWRPLLEAVASLVAIAIERLHYAEAAQRGEVEIVAERLRASILSSLSHDLRTPLTSLVGLADTLAQRQPPLPQDAVEVVGIIHDQAQAMYRMLSNLLEMARLQAGGVTLNREWQPFEEIVGSSTRLLAPMLTRHAVEVDLSPDLPLVQFDAVLLERVVCNLLENAAKYSPAGSRIRLSACVRDADLEVVVANAGPGFPPDRLDSVFAPFVRGEREPAVAGTGLGLAICKAIVEAHGGTIAAENRTGEPGACVRFTLPLGAPPTVDIEAAE